jgi:hypothetical protein
MMLRFVVSTLIVGAILAVAGHASALEFMTPGAPEAAASPSLAWAVAVLGMGGIGAILHVLRRRGPRLTGGLITWVMRQNGRQA